jgi:AmmeMemoRadiSam system protein A
MFNESQKTYLLKLARESITAHLQGNDLSMQCPEDGIFHQKIGGFVTLHKNGALRGCIGHVRAVETVFNTIREMAVAAAVDDPRFPPLKESELKDIVIEISLLSPLIQINSADEIKIGRDGIYLIKGYNSGLLLPQVALEWSFDTETFLQETCRKAGLPANAWKSVDTRIYRFEAEIFSELI